MSPEETHWRQSSDVYHKRAEEYDSWFENSLLFSIETEAVKALSVPDVSPALEIGVGPGRFAQALDSGFGIDPANAPLHIAAKRNITVCQAVGEALPFCDNSFLKVSLFFTLCFVQDPAQVMAEAHRVLQDDGHLLLGIVPSTSQWGAALIKKKNKDHPFYKYARFFTVEECETLIRSCGFAVCNSMSSLYQSPDSVTLLEKPHPGIDEKAGFVVLHLQTEL